MHFLTGQQWRRVYQKLVAPPFPITIVPDGTHFHLGPSICRLAIDVHMLARCPRTGRLAMARLLAEQGAALPIPALRRVGDAVDLLIWQFLIYQFSGVEWTGQDSV
jgi:hypothetical protein